VTTSANGRREIMVNTASEVRRRPASELAS
jgi:hypothetical protein